MVDGRACKVVLWNFAAEVTVAFDRDMLPSGLCINESSVWGPQLHEAWISGEAVQTGDLEFDLAFVVLGEETGTPPRAEDARRLSPALKACLLELRPQLRDAYVFADRLQVRIESSADHSTTTPSAQSHRFSWALGSAFLDFNRMLNAVDLHAGLARTVEAARAIECMASTEG